MTLNAVNRSPETYLDIAGKGVIVTRSLIRLGERAVHLTHLGGGFSPFFRGRAKEEGLKLVAVPAQAALRLCVTLLDTETADTTEIVEEGERVSSGTEQKIRKAFSRLLPRVRAVIISGSKAAGYSESLYPDMVRAARQAGKFTVIDFRGRDCEAALVSGPDIVKPNLNEFCQTFFPDRDPASRTPAILELIREKITELAARYRTVFVLTDGENEILYNVGRDVSSHRPSHVVPRNTTGCGDVFTAALASFFYAHHDIDGAVRFAAGQATTSTLTPRPGFCRFPS